MKNLFAQLRVFALLPVALALLASPLAAQETQSNGTDTQAEENTYTQDEILEKARGFFGETTEGLAEGIAKVFEDQGRPNAYIIGEEASGAIGVGLRYGKGELNSKLFGSRTVYWQGPSVGFDLGGNASRNMTLIYNLQDPEKLFQRFPGVDGSLYFVAGLSINYQRSGDITLAPIRTGVGLRAGASVGYLHYTKEKSLNPF
jgi:hypothetical protein